jgi:hypothetical protein
MNDVFREEWQARELLWDEYAGTIEYTVPVEKLPVVWDIRVGVKEQLSKPISLEFLNLLRSCSFKVFHPLKIAKNSLSTRNLQK